jgi:hypothetical protein
MKKSMLFLFGVGDTFFSDKSRRCIKRAPEIYSKIERAMKNDKNNFYGVVRFNEPSDTFEKVNLSDLVPSERIIDVKLCSNDPFGINNQISIPDIQNHDDLLLNGDQLDFLIRPHEYNLHIAGIDINGIFIQLINDLINKDYNVLVYSDAIKPYNRDTIEAIRNSKVRFRKS